MGKPKVLIVDDEKHIVDLVKYNLTKKGFDVLEAYDGVAGEEKARIEKPDLLILDIMLPGRNGIEVCKKLRVDPGEQDLPIIILSAKGDQFDKLTGFEAGADDYMTKPFNIDELAARVFALLRRSRRVREGHSEASGAAPAAKPGAKIKFGNKALDELIADGIPAGSNVLLAGAYGVGKTVACRDFAVEGLKAQDRVLYIGLEGSQAIQARNIEEALGGPAAAFAGKDSFRMVDLISAVGDGRDKLAAGPSIDELLERMIAAESEIGQDLKGRAGGRRVLDSISALVGNFGLALTFRFLSNFVHTSVAFGGAATLFTLEEGSLSLREENNIKNLMDCVIELKMEAIGVYARVLSLK